jgi:hypothetical protein
MAVKKIDHIQVEFELGKATQIYPATSETDVNFRIDEGTHALVIFEEDDDEKRVLTTYAPGKWSAVRLFWKGDDER